MEELSLDYYKMQHEKLLDRNLELETKVRELERVTDHNAAGTIKDLERKIDDVMHLLVVMDTYQKDRIIGLLIDDIYEVLGGEEDEWDSLHRLAGEYLRDKAP